MEPGRQCLKPYKCRTQRCFGWTCNRPRSTYLSRLRLNNGSQGHLPRKLVLTRNDDGGSNGSLSRSEYGQFVHYFRQASPYIVGHRKKTFVVVIPSQVVARDDLLESALQDIVSLAGLGVQLVMVLGTQSFINEALEARGMKPRYSGGYRITDKVALDAAVAGAGRARIKVEGFFSKGPSLSVMRRHSKRKSKQIHYMPDVRVVGGNYVAAKRRGIVNGVDYEYTGEVRCVLSHDILNQIKNGNIVLLSNLGYTATGQVVNCNVYDVGVHVAVELQADKLFCLHLEDVRELKLPHWLPLSDAYNLLGGLPSVKVSKDVLWSQEDNVTIDLNEFAECELPKSVVVSILACDQGVTRAHLVDAAVDGGLLLELYTRDGIGTMISTDFYQGIRPAAPADIPYIHELLEPLAEQGITVVRSYDDLAVELDNFRVFEQEEKLFGCVQVKELGESHNGDQVAEVAAFCVHPSFRGRGKGDSMLDYVEQDVRSRRIRWLVLLTTRTADWFVQRGFLWVGPAHENKLLPPSRLEKIDASRNAQLYVKELLPVEGAIQPAGKRVGF